MGGLIGGLFQANAAKKAAQAQAAAAAKDLAFQKETRDLIFARMDPFYQPGIVAQNALSYELGLGDRPADYRGFETTPGYQFQLDEGNANINALAGAKGGLHSGATLQALQRYGQGLASQEYGTYLDRLTGVAANGQNAAGTTAGAATNAAAGVSNALTNIGNARASGTVGFANGLASGINNQIGMWQYQKGIGGGGMNGNAGIFNPLFGGKGLGGFV